MTCSLLSLRVECQGNVSKSSACTNDSCVSSLIDSNTVEVSQVNNQMSVLSSKSMRSVTVPSRFRGDQSVAVYTAHDCVLYMLSRLRYSIGGRLEWYAKVEGLDSLRVVRST